MRLTSRAGRGVVSRSPFTEEDCFGGEMTCKLLFLLAFCRGVDLAGDDCKNIGEDDTATLSAACREG